MTSKEIFLSPRLGSLRLLCLAIWLFFCCPSRPEDTPSVPYTPIRYMVTASICHHLQDQSRAFQGSSVLEVTSHPYFLLSADDVSLRDDSLLIHAQCRSMSSTPIKGHLVLPTLRPKTLRVFQSIDPTESPKRHSCLLEFLNRRLVQCQQESRGGAKPRNFHYQSWPQEGPLSNR